MKSTSAAASRPRSAAISEWAAIEGALNRAQKWSMPSVVSRPFGQALTPRAAIVWSSKLPAAPRRRSASRSTLARVLHEDVDADGLLGHRRRRAQARSSAVSPVAFAYEIGGRASADAGRGGRRPPRRTRACRPSPSRRPRRRCRRCGPRPRSCAARRCGRARRPRSGRCGRASGWRRAAARTGWRGSGRRGAAPSRGSPRTSPPVSPMLAEPARPTEPAICAATSERMSP